MRAIICDKCGVTQPDTLYGTKAEVNREYIGIPAEIHLCSTCTEKFLAWVKGEEEPDHDTYPKITF